MRAFLVVLAVTLLMAGCARERGAGEGITCREVQLTDAPYGHILANVGGFSHDSQWLVYDLRSDPGGTVFDGTRIERVNVKDRRVEVLYRSKNGACCGVVTCSPADDRVAFILGPENPTPDWQYGASRRQGVVVRASRPDVAENLDARDMIPPYTPGALRGGTHVHVFSADGQWVSFTYNDQVLTKFAEETDEHQNDLRNVGVCAPIRPVKVGSGERNHDGGMFSVLVTRTTARPARGSDQIMKAFEDAWVGVDGYLRPDGTGQKRALAFQGIVLDAQGQQVSEVFIVDIPDDITVPGPDGPLEGTATSRPSPPRGCVQRRLTFTADRKFPGIQGPRHWLRSSPDGSRIAFLMKDDAAVVQLWTVSPNGGQPRQLTRNPWSIASAFTWSPDGRYIAHAMDNSVFITDTITGQSTRLTPRSCDEDAPRPESCAFSPDGKKIAYVRRVKSGPGRYNQIFVATLED